MALGARIQRNSRGILTQGARNPGNLRGVVALGACIRRNLQGIVALGARNPRNLQGVLALGACIRRNLRGILALGARTQRNFRGSVALRARVQRKLRGIDALGARTQCNLRGFAASGPAPDFQEMAGGPKSAPRVHIPIQKSIGFCSGERGGPFGQPPRGASRPWGRGHSVIYESSWP